MRSLQTYGESKDCSCPISLILLLAFCFPFWTDSAHAREIGPKLDVKLGIAGAWKLGKPCPVRVAIPAELSEATHLEIDSIDGDGVEVTYRTAVTPAAQNVGLTIRIGRERALLKLRLLSGERLLSEQQLDPQELAVELGPLQPLIVGLGSTLGAEQLVLRTPDGATSLTTVVVDSSDDLPDDALGMAACDLLIISTRDTSLLKQLSNSQWSAIQDWLRAGGGCLISLGGSAERLAELSSLQSMIVGRVVGEGMVSNPGPLETLVGPNDPLQPFPTSLVELDAGDSAEVVLSLSDSVGRRTTWWSTYAFGSGTVSLIASDLDHPTFADWEERNLLWERLVEPYFSRGMIESPEKEAALSAASSFLGYSDIVGQLRATLDRFDSVLVVSFGQISAILIATLLLVGPIDYFVSVKWFRRPELSWYLTGASLLLISGGLAWYYTSIRPDKVLVNSAEIIDVDTTTGQVRGNLWFHVYSSRAETFDITASALERRPVILDWQGLPGGGLGGLSSQLTVDRGMPGYLIERSDSTSTRIESLGVPAGGTKSLVGSWSSPFTDATLVGGTDIDSGLKELAGVDQLQGYFTNPLSVDLKDATLFYHDWYYILNSRITAGERVVISADQIPKDVTRKLNRQRNVDGSVSITRWDPADRENLDQLLELMMFFDAASGVNYASLSHRFQADIDHSQLLQLDKAIVIGRIDESPVEIDVVQHADDAPSSLTERELSRTWCRIILPVTGKR